MCDSLKFADRRMIKIIFLKIAVENAFGLLPNKYLVYDENNVNLTEHNFTGYMTQMFKLNISWFIIKKTEPTLVPDSTIINENASEIEGPVQVESDATLPHIYLNPTGFFKHVFLKVNNYILWCQILQSSSVEI